jgi:cytochrome bd-type quinol oxidase subunit 2
MTDNKYGMGGNLISRAVRFGNRFIDYRMAIGGAIVMGCIVFWINYTSTKNTAGSSTAAVKQGVYTFLFGGLIMKSCERLATEIRKKAIAIAVAVIIPSLAAIGLTFCVHSLKGTPLPLLSTLPTVLLVIPSTVVWAIRKRRQSGTDWQEKQSD